MGVCVRGKGSMEAAVMTFVGMTRIACGAAGFGSSGGEAPNLAWRRWSQRGPSGWVAPIYNEGLSIWGRVKGWTGHMEHM